MHERTVQLVRIAVLSVFVIGTSPYDRDTVVLAQVADAPQNAVTTGELVIEPPTLINLGFEWFIQGDEGDTGQGPRCSLASLTCVGIKGFARTD